MLFAPGHYYLVCVLLTNSEKICKQNSFKAGFRFQRGLCGGRGVTASQYEKLLTQTVWTTGWNVREQLAVSFKVMRDKQINSSVGTA